MTTRDRSRRKPRSSGSTYEPLSDGTSTKDKKSSVPLIEQIPLKRSQSFPNLSVSFADGYAFWLYYLCTIFISWYSFVLFPFMRFWPALTIVNIVHATVTFYFMHWRRGTPDAFDAGRNDRYTFWEMLDEGNQYTPTRKFFTVVPIVVFLGACYEHDWKKRYYFANIVALLLSVVPKLPMMMGVRFLGINNK